MHALALPGGPPWRSRPGAPTTLRQCITLALLLHVLLVLVFGNTEGGSAVPGQGVWGSLNIRLAGSDASGRAEATPPSDAYSGPQGQARERRWGGAVRAPQDQPEAHRDPGAARQGLWQPQPMPEPAPPLPTEAPAAAGVDPPAPAPAPSPAPEPPALRLPPAARATDAQPAITSERSAWGLPATSLQSMPLPALNLPPAPAPNPTPSSPPEPALPPRAPPLTSRSSHQALQAPPLVPPGAGPLPLPDLALQAPEPVLPSRSVAPRALAPAIRPTSEPLLQAPAVPQLPVPVLATAPAPAAEPVSTPQVPARLPTPARASANPITAAPTPELAQALPEAVPLPSLVVAPAPAPLAAGAAPAAAAPTAPAAATAAATAPAAAPAPSPLTTPGGPVAGNPVAASATAVTTTAPGAGPGAPDAGARLGHDVATAPSLPASAPRLNLDLVRPRGGPVSAQGPRGLLPVLPHPPEQPSKLARDIDKAGKPDCRQAYSGMGLLAMLPLAADALRDKGCRW